MQSLKRRLPFENDLIKLAKLELHLPFFPLVQKPIYLVASTIKIAIAHSEIGEDSLEPCFNSYLSIPVNREECIIDHPAEDSFVAISWFFCVESVAIIVCD